MIEVCPTCGTYMKESPVYAGEFSCENPRCRAVAAMKREQLKKQIVDDMAALGLEGRLLLEGKFQFTRSVIVELLDEIGLFGDVLTWEVNPPVRVDMTSEHFDFSAHLNHIACRRRVTAAKIRHITEKDDTDE